MARRGRKPASEVAEAATIAPAAAETETAEQPVRRRRRRRTTGAPDYASETGKLIDAILRSRGTKGATQEVLNSVIGWARGVRAEGDALRELAGRPRRQKAQASTDRVARFELNRALLEGVLSGAIALDVLDNGELVFLHTGGDVVGAASAAEAAAGAETGENGAA